MAAQWTRPPSPAPVSVPPAALQPSSTTAGRGMMTGRQVDPWGIGQSITDSVGYTGSALGGFGRNLESAGTLLVGLLVIGAGAVLLGAQFLQTAPGRGLRRAGGAAATVIALAPK